MNEGKSGQSEGVDLVNEQTWVNRVDQVKWANIQIDQGLDSK